MQTEEDLQKRIEEAKLLKELEIHPAWGIVKSRLETQIKNDRDSLEQFSMDHDNTQRLRSRLEIMRLVLRVTQLASEQQLAKWTEQLAFAKKMGDHREAHGLPRDLKVTP